METTTNPEDEGVGEDFLAEDADTAEHVASEVIFSNYLSSKHSLLSVKDVLTL